MVCVDRSQDQSLPVKTRSALPRSLEMTLSHDEEWLQIQECFAIQALEAERVAGRCQDENRPVRNRSALPGALATITSLNEEDSDEEGFSDDGAGECKGTDSMTVHRTISANCHTCPFVGCPVTGSSVFISRHERVCPCRMNGRGNSAPKPTLKKRLSKQLSSTSLSPASAAQGFFQAPLNAGRRR